MNVLHTIAVIAVYSFEVFLVATLVILSIVMTWLTARGLLGLD